jgi:hypothetical protein
MFHALLACNKLCYTSPGSQRSSELHLTLRQCYIPDFKTLDPYVKSQKTRPLSTYHVLNVTPELSTE